MNTDEEVSHQRLHWEKMGQDARKAAQQLALAEAVVKTQALQNMAQIIVKRKSAILKANDADIRQAQAKGLSTAFLDRLALDEKRLGAITEGLERIASLEDPIGKELASWTRPNGLRICRVSRPLGVVGVIYESRPNVTVDAAALCLKAGNAVILRGGSDAYFSSMALYKAMQEALEGTELPAAVVQYVESRSRDVVGAMLAGLGGTIDVLVPRGGKSLVRRVQEEARVPVFAHLEGLCHLYIDQSAQATMAENIVVNSKMRRTGVCGAVETLLIDKNASHELVAALLRALDKAGCQVRVCERLHALFPLFPQACEKDWRTEYLDSVLSVKMVDGVEGAIAHIQKYSSHHTESIVAENLEVVNKFFRHIDSAIVLHNASTQFADGGEFGFGGEIGIATGKMHARGPIGVEQLTCFHYEVHGNGQVRP